VSPLPIFGFVAVHRQPLADGVGAEADWLERCAATGHAAAHLWTAPVGLVVPRRYATLPGWAAAPKAGVQVRASGGGLVPQGPGLWNLTLIWPAASAAPDGMHTIYQAFCAELAAAFARLGLRAEPGEVAGSFCDGRWNLALGGRKFLGTAQAWRRIAGRTLVMAHAVIVVDADPQALTDRCNAFEAALGSGVGYRADALTSLAREVADPRDLEARTLAVLAEQFAHVLMKE
jgi:lipoate-protein ligase A